MKMRFAPPSLPFFAIAAIALAGAGCSMGKAKKEMMGGATVTGGQVANVSAPLPAVIYVEDFTVAPGAIKQASGLLSEMKDATAERPHLLGGGGGLLGGGILGRREQSDTPSAQSVVSTLAESITKTINEQNLGIPAQRLPEGYSLPTSGWVVRGQFVSVDPGNRAERAVIGFGTGEATTQVNAEVDQLTPEGGTQIITFGTNADSGKSPGAVVTMNPYVAAAKFVIGKNATSRDITNMGEAIGKRVAKLVRGEAAPE